LSIRAKKTLVDKDVQTNVTSVGHMTTISERPIDVFFLKKKLFFEVSMINQLIDLSNLLLYKT